MSLHQQQAAQQMQHSTVDHETANLQQHLQQQQLQQPLIQEVAALHVTNSDRDQAPHEGLQDSAASKLQSSQQHQNTTQLEQVDIVSVNHRLQALEASSRRMERKVDQILEYCRTLAQAVNLA